MKGFPYSWYNRRVTRISVMVILCLTAGIGMRTASFGRGLTKDSIYYIITVRHFGTDPERIERTITIPLENGISSLPGITEIRSVSELNTSRITIQIDRGTDLPSFFLLLRDAVDSVYETFPHSVQRPEIFSTTGVSHPVMVIALQSPADYIEKEIKPALKKISGIGEIVSGGEAAVELHIKTKSAQLNQAGISVPRLGEIIRSSQGNTQTGSIAINGLEKPVQLMGRIHSLAELKRLPLSLPGGRIVSLRQLAGLNQQTRHRDTISRLDGQLFTILYVKDSGLRSPVEISRAVRKNLTKISTDGYDIIYDFGRTLELSIREAAVTIFISMGIAAFFLAIFFNKGNAPLVLALLIPLNVLITLGCTSLFRLPVDTSMLAGVAFGIGIICDGGIVVTHTIIHNRKIEGILRLFSPLISGAATTIIAAVPLFFLPGNPGSVKQMTISFVILVAVSTGTCLLFLPPLLDFRSDTPRKSYRGIVKMFWKFIRFPFHIPAAPLILGAVLTAAGICSLAFLPRSISQIDTEPIVYGQMECKRGASIEFVDKELQRVFSRFSNLPGIEKVETLARRNRGTFSVHFDPNLIPRDQVTDTLYQANALYTSSFLYVSGTNSGLTEVKLDFIGPETGYLKQLAGETAGLFQSFHWVDKAVLHFTNGEPGWTFKPDREKMAAARLPFQQVAGSLRWGLFGPVVFKWIDVDKERDVRVMGERSTFEPMEEIQNGGVLNQDNRFIPLLSLGSFQLKTEESAIHRLNRQRSASISIQTQLSSLKDLRKKLQAATGSFSLKQGYGIRIDPSLKHLEENYAALRYSLVMALVLVYMVLAAQYESFSAPLIIFLSIPLSLSFPLIGLLLFGRHVTPASFIGMVMVTGLSVNNAILIVEDVLCRHGSTSPGRIKKKVLSALRTRVSPLALTTGSTLLGLIPLFFYSGYASGMVREVAFTVFTGIAGSAVVTFLLIPAFITRWPVLAGRFKSKN